MENSLKAKNYCGLDIGKFIMSFFVILAHSSFQSVFNEYSYIFENLFHISVTFFFLCSGYFICEKNYDEEKILLSAKKHFSFYISWSLVYLPLTIYGEIFWKTPLLKAIAKLAKNYLFVGVNFYSWHLWYLLASSIAFFIIHFLTKKKIDINKIFVISLCLYLISIFINFSSNNPSLFPEIYNKIIRLYFYVFNTVRNGLFEGFFYVALGMIISKFYKNYNVFITVAFLVSGTIGYIFMKNEIIIKLFQPIFAVGVFMLFLLIKPKNKKICLVLRNNSSVIYFVHMYYLFLYRLIFTDLNSDFFNYASAFLFTAILSYVTSILIYVICSKHKSKLTKKLFGI